jgi:hypothetical protein
MRFYSCDSNRTSTRSDRIQDSPKQGKERPFAECRHTTSRRHGTVRRLDAGRLVARRQHSHGRGCMGESICSTRTRVKQARKKWPKGRGFTPCPVTHGGSTMAVLGLALKAAERRQGSRGRRRCMNVRGRVSGDGRWKALRTSPFFPARACTRHPAWQRSWRRGKQAGEVPSTSKRSQRLGLELPGRCACMRGCTAARWHAGFHKRSGVRMPVACSGGAQQGTVRLPLHEQLRLHNDDGSTGRLPRLLLLHSFLIDVTGGGLGRGNPSWLGLASGACGAS